MVGGGDRKIVRVGVVVGAVVVIEGGERQQEFRVEGVHPGSIQDRVALVLPVAQAAAVVLGILKVVRIRIVGDLVVVLAQRGHQAQLVRRVGVEDQRGEAAISVLSIVDHLRNGRLQSQIAAVAVHAGVVGKALGMAAEAELVVGLVEVAEAGDQFGLVVALESGARGDVEDAVGAVAKLRAVTAAVGFQILEILGIELRPEVGGDIGVGNGNAIHQPAHLMPAANVELVMRDVSSGNVVGDHGQAVAAVGAGGPLHIQAADQGGGRRGVRRRSFSSGGDGNVFTLARDLKLKMRHRLSAGNHNDILRRLDEPRTRHRDRVFADGHGVELELAIAITGRGLGPIGRLCPQGHHGALDGAMLGIVNQAANAAEDGGLGGSSTKQQQEKNPVLSHGIVPSSQRTQGTLVITAISDSRSQPSHFAQRGSPRVDFTPR